ncbi:cytochrome c biogenesis CcdA family protein [Pelagibacterium halotolerans]|uniref:Cytochrome c-type biogenesis protein CcdA (DsbD-like protein) n=1 Tax=Pelagibacterium halotolerans (strain DSM 22347 / JCM 15775 / CGMCC 1.7692 / B2) TaxID=1082931 RepID=G4RE55_PELHB|nr:cytochrome c biogenesis protein CcdA [Pelagibacterium halotolerans]AEQ51819.1 cytochrome c-type biogenesis protein CcdA (DsbD-like protein) [Pelagibacterium halotolerans B2]QJR18371.1 cytochrome C biogenesis protein CcdA [Pelagibacterium halotolerans]SEA24326.1 cytochrome c-type biogenesis protein [Pelagibacterium halotolerans]
MFGFELPAVFGAGILSFLSPCVLPLVPAYLTYMSGATFERLREEGVAGGRLYGRTLVTALAFVLGFSLIFIAFGATATFFGQALRRALPVLMPLAGVVIIIMGLHFLGLLRISWLYRQFRFEGPKMASGPLGGFLLGLAFAIGWTPCIGPMLAAILTVAANQQTAWEGASLLAVYSAGLGVPFILAALALGPFLSFFEGFKKHLGTVEKVMGALLVVVGILFLTGNFTRLAFWMQANFEVLNRFG